MLGMAICCGNSGPAPGSLASPSPTVARMASSMLPFYRELAAGRAWSPMPKSICACAMQPWDLPARPRTFRSTLLVEASSSCSSSVRPRPRTTAMHSLVSAVVLLAILQPAAAADEATLRVCADPNNLPFSNRAGAGFENKLAELAAQKLGKTVSYTWWAQRRGFIRHTLKAGDCDVVMGVPAHYDLVETTRPYYRSTYVFVSQAARLLQLNAIDDPQLRRLSIGVHLIGDDGNNTPPAHALGQQGIVDNVRGYMIYGDYREPDPPARLIEAGGRGGIDVAAAWGPLAGYAAKKSPIPLTVTPILASELFAPQQFQFDIAMGVRKGDHALRDRLNEFIAQNGEEIAALLVSYGVPLMEKRFSSTAGVHR